MKRTVLFLAILALAASPAAAQPNAPHEFEALVFTKTAGFRHSSIPDGIAAIVRLGQEHRFGVDATEDANIFTPDLLQKYDVVVFLSTTGDILNSEQEAALQAFVEQGGGLVGIHAAADTEYEWPWYGQAIGGYFRSHPRNQTATIHVEDATHPATAHLPSEWVRLDEWYNYRQNPRENVHVLMTLDESTYEGGQMEGDHPISWANMAGEGRVFYSGLGHTEESYTEAEFVQHILGGIRWAAGQAGDDLGDAGALPAGGSFEKVILNDDTLDPFELDVANDGRVFFIERAGTLRIWHPESGTTSTAGYVPVRMTGENGMLGLALDPNFDANHWIYLLHTVPDGEPRQRLSRFFLDETEQLDLESEKVLLEIPLTLGECCHSGGSLAFGPDGSLFISIGDETNPFASDGYNPIDERKGRDVWDAQRSAANPNDLRGKILRIRPLPDGTYEIPSGNLFAADDPETRGEIYVMGNRNPFRITIDQKTGWLFWGEVGPDAGAPNPERGPAGHDEINLAKAPGNYGWPYFTGDNKAYHDFDYSTATPGGPFDPAHPVNDSPNNTGRRELPPAQPALIWYTYGPSEEFPQLEAGGRTAIAGAVYRHDPSHEAVPGALPASFDGVFFFGEWQRNQLFTAHLDEQGNLLGFQRFMPETEFLRPMDMDIGPDGRLYLIEWGTAYGGNNPDAKIVRLDYRPSVSASNSERRSASGLRFVTPLTGTVANGGSVRYEVALPEGVAGNAVRVEAVLESDGNVLARSEATGATGTLMLPDGTSRWPVFVSRRWRLTASAGDRVTEAVFVYPPAMESEHTDRYYETTKVLAYDAASQSTESGLLLGENSWVAYGPLVLNGVNRVSADVSPLTPGTLEFRADSVAGAVLAAVPVAGRNADASVADTATVAASFRVLFDDDNLYLLADVKDDDIRTNAEMESFNDRIELYFDAGHEAGISYDDNDLRIDLPIGRGPHGAASRLGPPELTYAMSPVVDGSYRLEASIPWTTLGIDPTDGRQFGFEINLNDQDEGRPDRTLAWAATRDAASTEPRVFGTLQLGGEPPRGRRFGSSLVATRTTTAISADGEAESAWTVVEPTVLRRHLTSAPANRMRQVETFTADITAPDGPVDLYVVFRPESERGRVFVDRVRFE
ncbi:MAG TPA: ThuA domain-containing protein [Rhodothermales bacterium]